MASEVGAVGAAAACCVVLLLVASGLRRWRVLALQLAVGGLQLLVSARETRARSAAVVNLSLSSLLALVGLVLGSARMGVSGLPQMPAALVLLQSEYGVPLQSSA